ncbi:hypothetical protein pdam_00020861 [Pocillopora damicornis]|uniref:Uncharacterized protein n=1 Tax=Pocillopora damicornis TaxID=46731 RepID=A0A3M6UUV0_POCDA|nr:hypothetical protein pdam_00020861 [Pocillopora damicornis]
MGLTTSLIMGLIALNRYMKVAKRTIYIEFLPTVCTFTITSGGYIPHEVRKCEVSASVRHYYGFGLLGQFGLNFPEQICKSRQSELCIPSSFPVKELLGCTLVLSDRFLYH